MSRTGESFLNRILSTEPAVFKSIVGALVAVLLIWLPELDWLADRINDTGEIVFSVILPGVTIITGFSIRKSVTPVGRAKHLAADDR